MPDDREPFGDKTIEGAFLNDVEYGFDSDLKEIEVCANGVCHEIHCCNLELERESIDMEVMGSTQHTVVRTMYRLTVPVELPVNDTEDVVVRGFEATWTFPDVEVITIHPDSTTVLSRTIDKSYGDTGQPDEYEQEE